MPVVTSLSSLSGTSITDEQIHAILNSISLKMYNINNADGYLGGIDHEEFGDTGARVYFSNSVRELLAQHKYFSELLANPELRGQVGFYLTQNEPPNMVSGDNDSNRVQ